MRIRSCASVRIDPEKNTASECACIDSKRSSDRINSRPAQLAQLLDHARVIFRMRVQARARRRAADAQAAQAICRQCDLVPIAPHGLGIRAELLPQAHGHGILQMRAPRLHDRIKFLRFGLQGRRQPIECGEHLIQPPQHAQPDRRGNRIVGRLRHVDVIVGADQFGIAALAAQNLNRPIGDHLVGVHVVAGARARLKRIDAKLIVPLAVDHFLRGLHDRRRRSSDRAAPNPD